MLFIFVWCILLRVALSYRYNTMFSSFNEINDTVILNILAWIQEVDVLLGYTGSLIRTSDANTTWHSEFNCFCLFIYQIFLFLSDAEAHSQLSPYLSYISGALAGCAATVGSYPFDLLRTILASQGEPKVQNLINDLFYIRSRLQI